MGLVVSKKKIFFLFFFPLKHEVYVALATRVPVRSAQKQYATIPTVKSCCVCNLIKIHQLALDILTFEWFSIVSLWRLNDPGAWPHLIPGA